ncbi:hypothetical protein D3C76_1331920 [compost metagenome]
MRRHVEQRERLSRYQGNPCCARKVIGCTQRQQHQASLISLRRQRFSDVAQGTVATSGNQSGKARSQCLLHQTLGVPGFPRQAHRQFPALFALFLDRRTDLFVECLLTVQNQQRLALTHRHLPG